MKKTGNRGGPYWCGWLDGRYGATKCFTTNRRLAQWETPSDRLDYYRGHRAGRETRRRGGDLTVVA